MKRIINRKVEVDDRLKLVVVDMDTGRTYVQGKRVAKNCPLRRSEIRAYVEGNEMLALRRIRLNRGGNLRACKTLLDRARYGTTDAWNLEGR